MQGIWDGNIFKVNLSMEIFLSLCVDHLMGLGIHEALCDLWLFVIFVCPAFILSPPQFCWQDTSLQAENFPTTTGGTDPPATPPTGLGMWPSPVQRAGLKVRMWPKLEAIRVLARMFLAGVWGKTWSFFHWGCWVSRIFAAQGSNGYQMEKIFWSRNQRRIYRWRAEPWQYVLSPWVQSSLKLAPCLWLLNYMS